MVVEPYKFQNIYLITTYRCNWRCQFCLFRYNEETEAPVYEVISRLEYAINDSDRPVYIKITGGEPFLRLDLLEAVIELCNKNRDKIYKIGIGSNGSIPVPKFFNKLKIRTHIFLSRHDCNNYLTPKMLARFDNTLIDFRLNCNLIKGGVDSLDKIKRHIWHYQEQGITHFCFRELTKVNVDDNCMYPQQIYDYDNYYNEKRVLYSSLKEELDFSGNFVLSRKTGNEYDTNEWYWYNDTSVKFRMIDEGKLLDYNRNNDGVDEYVIHPDGTLTGCWDKEMKIIKGGE